MPPKKKNQATQGDAAAADAAADAATATADATADAASLQPTDRDCLLGEGSAGHKTNLLLQDMMRLHRILWKLLDKPVPKKKDQAMPIAESLFSLVKNGKAYELAGFKDVPKPFMKSKGRFLEKKGDNWIELDDDEAKDNLAKAMIVEFGNDDLGDLTQAPYKDLKDLMTRKSETNTDKDGAAVVFPQPKDAILLSCDSIESATSREKMYEQQVGNKTVFNLASQLVTIYTGSSEKRVEAALNIMKGLEEAEIHEEDKDKTVPSIIPKNSRFLLRSTSEDDGSVAWSILDASAAAEFAVIFVFEVFLEKEISPSTAGAPDVGASIAHLAPSAATKPSTEPVSAPTEHDVLFGRGGMTNSHAGNRRFRDVIALHRPDYIRAIKMDKPAVARKIVRAIRTGDPPGRFLKKGEDGNWYDVGDRTAAEKTSQGLRERSNAEKRQRSALREALRIRKQDMAESDSPVSKKAKTSQGIDIAATIPTLNYIGTNLAVPLSLNMKETKVKRTKDKDAKTGEAEEELNTEGLPPNAVDEDGNILVTDYDILCGRGGLTNHHKGNKRFRDIVALHRPDYVRAPKIQKPSVARVIVRAIRNGDPPGRFLKKDEKTGKWYDVGDKKAAEKTSQALREKSNEERDKLKRDPSTLGVQVLLPNPSSYLAAVTGTPLILPGIQPPSAAPVPADKKAEEKTKPKEGEAEGKADDDGEKKEAPIEEETPETEEVEKIVTMSV